MGEKEMLVHKSHNTDATNAACFSGGVEVLTGKRFPLLPSSFFHFARWPPYVTNFVLYSPGTPLTATALQWPLFFVPANKKSIH